MRYASVCSGIEVPGVAWQPLGWIPIFFSEIDPFASAVLRHRYPEVPNLGDMTRISDEQIKQFPVDLLVAGTPCQSFSVGGRRGGMADPRGNLAKVFLGLVERARPRWMVWENVPGVLSSWTDAATFAPSEESRRLLEADGLDAGDFVEVEQTNDFDQFTHAIIDIGYSCAWGVLDAQYFGLAQRRERVFVVASPGNWTDCAAVLFDRESVSGNPPPCREAGARIAASLTRGADSSGRGGYASRRREDDSSLIEAFRTSGNCGVMPQGDRVAALNCNTDLNQQIIAQPALHVDICPAIKSRDYKGPSSDGDGDGDGAILVPMISQALRADGFDASEDGTGRGTPIVAEAVAFQTRIGRNGRGQPKEIADALTSCDGGIHADSKPHVAQGMTVRRLTPRECERLQGFPDDWTLIQYRGRPAADGPRYRAVRNAMAVPVVRWIGERIQRVSERIR